MNLGVIAKPNSKGQVVIPKAFRKALNITSQVPLHMVIRGGGIFVAPIRGLVTDGEATDKTDLFRKILAKTRGSWAGDDWDETVKKRRKIELKASKIRKAQSW